MIKNVTSLSLVTEKNNFAVPCAPCALGYFRQCVLHTPPLQLAHLWLGYIRVEHAPRAHPTSPAGAHGVLSGYTPPLQLGTQGKLPGHTTPLQSGHMGYALRVHPCLSSWDTWGMLSGYTPPLQLGQTQIAWDTMTSERAQGDAPCCACAPEQPEHRIQCERGYTTKVRENKSNIMAPGSTTSPPIPLVIQ